MQCSDKDVSTYERDILEGGQEGGQKIEKGGQKTDKGGHWEVTTNH